MGENWVVRWGTIGLFPGSANFCQNVIGYLPCGGKLGCLAGKNRVVQWGAIGLFGGEQQGCFPAAQIFWQNISVILLSHD